MLLENTTNTFRTFSEVKMSGRNITCKCFLISFCLSASPKCDFLVRNCNFTGAALGSLGSGGRGGRGGGRGGGGGGAGEAGEAGSWRERGSGRLVTFASC